MEDERPQLTKFRILIYAVFLASGCALCGCQFIAPLIIGPLPLGKERGRIRISEDESVTKGCDLVKHVEASTTWGGIYQAAALEKTINDLTHASIEAGADLLLIRSKQNSFFGSKSQGDAYRCRFVEVTAPPKALEESTDTTRTNPP